MHYALHHTKLPQYMKEMKKYHLAHHYKNFDLGFGVTCESSPSALKTGLLSNLFAAKIWDYAFNTVLPV